MAFGSIANISSEKKLQFRGMRKVFLFNNVARFKYIAINMDSSGGMRFYVQIH